MEIQSWPGYTGKQVMTPNARAKRREQKDNCTYCGIPLGKDKTMDHVPPKAIVKKEFRKYLKTVPSCAGCNNGASKDDEYFVRITLTQEVSQSPHVDEVLDAFLRNLDREESAGYRQDFADSLTSVPFLNENMEIESSPGYTIDMNRIGNVIFRTVKGLLWIETGLHVPSNFGIVMVPYINLEFLHTDLRHLFIEILAGESGFVRDKKIVVPDVFEYWWKKRSLDEDLGSAWVLRFYKHSFFVCIVTPRIEEWADHFRDALEEDLIVVSNEIIC